MVKSRRPRQRVAMMIDSVRDDTPHEEMRDSTIFRSKVSE
jgi:hypothetical protein